MKACFQFGLAAGLFFAGYVNFAVPSNLLLARIGGRVWIPLIMLAWGIASLCNAWVQGPSSFYLVRLALGIGESGLYPGLLYILVMWAPEKYRVRMLMMMILSTPFSVMVGSLISQPILMLDGTLGLKGWQWLFILQALPTLGLALLFWFALPEGPQTAPWLSPAQRQWLVAQLEAERGQREAVRRFRVKDVLFSPVVWIIALAGTGINAAAYGLILFLPQIIHGLGVSTSMTPLVNAVPYAFAALMMVFWSIRSDQKMERNIHAAIPAACAGLALVSCALLRDPVAILAALTFGITGVFCYVAVFWAVPSAMLTGPAAAAGLALINAIANLGSFAGPYFIGWVKDQTGSFSAGIVALGAGPLFAAAVAASLTSVRKFAPPVP